MSGSAGGANLPATITLEGVEQFKAAAREAASAIVQQAEAANRAAPAVTSAADAFGRLEDRTNAARRGLNDLRSAMELLGAGGAAGVLAPVANGLGNVADLFATAGAAAGRFGGALGTLSTTAATAAGLIALPALLQAVGLGINQAGTSAETTASAMDAWKATIDRLNPSIERQTQLLLENANAQRTRNLAEIEGRYGALVERRGTLLGRIPTSDAQIRRAEADLAAASDRIAREARRPLSAERRDFLQGQLQQAENALRRLQGDRALLFRHIDDIDSTRTELDAALRRYAAPIIYTSPAGPELPGRRGGAASRGANDDDSGFWRAEETARRAASAAISADQRARDQIERQFFESAERMERQSIESFARIGENAADRIGTGLVQAFVSGQGAAVNFGSLLNSVIASAAADLAKLGLINPASNAIFGTSRPTLVGAFSGLGGISNLLPGGLGSSVSGFLSTPLFSAGGFTAGERAFLGAAGIANPGAFTIGSALGYAGAGALGGGLLATLTGGNQLGGSIGGAGGALAGAAIGSIIPGVGTVIGGLVGGLAGGGLGGLFGSSGPGFQGGDALIGVGPDGLLRVSGSAGKGFDTAGLVASAQQQVAALNAQLRSAGIFLNPDLASQQFVAAIGGGQSGNATDLLGALSRGNLSGQLRSNDPRLQAALSGGDFTSALNEAARLGQLRQAGAAGISGLADYAASLRLANDNSGNPLTRLTTAEQQFAATADAARRGDLGAIGRLPQVAEQYRQLSRGVFGTGQGFAAAEQRIIAALDGVTSAGADQLTASFFSETVDSQTIRLEDALSRLTAEVAGLRADTRQASTNPLLARAA